MDTRGVSRRAAFFAYDTTAARTVSYFAEDQLGRKLREALTVVTEPGT